MLLTPLTPGWRTMMRRFSRTLWQDLWRSLVYLADSEPPKLVEFVMLVLGFGLLCMAFVLAVFLSRVEYQPYLVLAVVFAIGSALLCLVQEAIHPSTQTLKVRLANVILLGLSLGTLWLTVHYAI